MRYTTFSKVFVFTLIGIITFIIQLCINSYYPLSVYANIFLFAILFVVTFGICGLSFLFLTGNMKR